MTVICYWEVSLILIYFRNIDFTMMSLKKKQRLLSADDTDLNVERKKSEWLRNTMIMIWDSLQIKISAVLQRRETTSI